MSNTQAHSYYLTLASDTNTFVYILISLLVVSEITKKHDLNKETSD